MGNEKPAPSLEGLKYIKGTQLDLEAGLGKKAFVVEFWATWCPPCRTSIPHLTELAHKYQDVVEFVGVTSETEENNVRPFVEKMAEKMDYAVAMDAKGSVSSAYMGGYGVSGIPHAFVIDMNGNVSWHGHPADPEFEKALLDATSRAGSPPHGSSSTSSTTSSSTAHHYTLEQIAKMSEDEMVHLSAKDLRGICQEYNVEITACLEKGDYVEAIRGSIH